MILKDCKWEKGKFIGVDKYGVDIEMDEYQVVNADELKRELSKCQDGKDTQFKLQMYTNGVYSSLWNWDFVEDRDEAPTSYQSLTCSHEWVNVGFMSVKMACKHCDADAPNWIQNRHDPQAW